MSSKVPQYTSGTIHQSQLHGQDNGQHGKVNQYLATEFAQLVESLLESYEVPDILLPSSTVIFILESPHVQELEFGAPVSGLSGITMTRHLFGDEYAKFALGRLVKKNAQEQKHRPRLDRIGLMNVANIPLQSSAYRNPQLIKQHETWFSAMSMVRQNNQRNRYQNDYADTVQAFFAHSLRQKLLSFQSSSCIFVPCGRFAQKFFRLADVSSPSWQVIQEVPHPSYNSWDRAQYSEVIGQVCAALDG